MAIDEYVCHQAVSNPRNHIEMKGIGQILLKNPTMVENPYYQGEIATKDEKELLPKISPNDITKGNEIGKIK